MAPYSTVQSFLANLLFAKIRKERATIGRRQEKFNNKIIPFDI